MEIWCLQKVYQDNLSRICFVIECVRLWWCCLQGRHNIGTAFFIRSALCTMQFCDIKFYAIPLPRMKFVLGWGMPLLCKVFGGWLPSPSSACLINISSVVFVLDFQSLINHLCAKFHTAIFSPSCCLYCLFRSEHSTYFILSKVCQFVGGLKQKCIICLQINFYATI